MLEPEDAKDLIDEAIERAEDKHDDSERDERAKERKFRDRVSLLVGIFAVSLAFVHMAAAGAQRESLRLGIEASDTFAYMQAKIVRETVLKTATADQNNAAGSGDWAKEAKRLRAPDKAGHGITQLQKSGEQQRETAEHSATIGEHYEISETALQMAIVLLSIALIGRSWVVASGASLIALSGIAFAILTKLGVIL
ncbi:DUF4337 family protein [Sphingomonas sp.]|uniref:DUF4337 family protein n=1 Tax=Sphingomonas sp. TaxID=28214 RepID=UPI0025E59B4A|nr:DUF4337 family protein [Sphingomonas sp.]